MKFNKTVTIDKKDVGLTMYTIVYYRSVHGGLRETVGMEMFGAKTKTELMKHVRENKKKLAQQCVYRTTGDVITYKIEE